MPVIAVPAHFNGEKIVLDEPYNLPVNRPLLVTVLPPADVDSVENWMRAAASNQAFEFLKDPAEDIYSATDGEPWTDAV